MLIWSFLGDGDFQINCLGYWKYKPHVILPDAQHCFLQQVRTILVSVEDFNFSLKNQQIFLGISIWRSFGVWLFSICTSRKRGKWTLSVKMFVLNSIFCWGGIAFQLTLPLTPKMCGGSISELKPDWETGVFFKNSWRENLKDGWSYQDSFQRQCWRQRVRMEAGWILH